MSRAIYVRSSPAEVWTVHRDDSSRALSTHDSETAAELAAEQRASRSGGPVVIIDRSGCVDARHLVAAGERGEP